MRLHGELVFLEDHGEHVFPYELHGFDGVNILGAKTFDHPRAIASAASPELVVVVVLSSLIIARLMALRSNGDQSLSSRFS